MDTGAPSARRLANVSRSIMRASVNRLMRANTSCSRNVSNHSDCQRTSVRAGSTTRWNWARYVSALAWTSSRVSMGRVAFFSDGSPIWAVVSPTTRTATWPRSWNARSRSRTTA